MSDKPNTPYYGAGSVEYFGRIPRPRTDKTLGPYAHEVFREPGPWETVFISIPGRSGIYNATDKLDPLGTPPRIPGVCEVKLSKARKVEEKTAEGGHGAVLTPKGTELATITITVTVSTPKQLEQLRDLLSDIDPLIVDDAKNPKQNFRERDNAFAIDVVHPAMRMRKIRSMLVVSITGPDKDGSTAKCVINAKQFAPRPEKKPAAKPAKPISGLKGAEVHDQQNVAANGRTTGDYKSLPPTPKGPGK